MPGFMLREKEMKDLSKDKERRNGAVQVCSGWVKNAEHSVQAKTRIKILEERLTLVPNKLNQTLKMLKVVTGGCMISATHLHLHIQYVENTRTLRR